MKPVKGKKYNVTRLKERKFTGWKSPDPRNCQPDVVEGYHIDNYFESDGTYIGADVYGVEPSFRSLAFTRQ